MTTLALLCCMLAANAAAEPYAWPLDLPRELTSSFAEYRPGRFHAGIDLRTGTIGQPVHAAADGYVSRVRCSPFGYGKAVYITLTDGNTVVYGHLSDYRDDLRDFVRAAQHKAESYTVDLEPAAGQFKVKRGEVIALSGDTGIGVPHLHWEFRDKAGRMVNPRLLGITWPDTTRPTLSQLLVWPQGGTVNGDCIPQILPLTQKSDGHYTAAPIRVTGPFTLGIATTDPAAGGAKLGIHEATASLDGTPLFTVRNDTLDYDTTDTGAVAWAPCLSTKEKFLTLWRYPGNASPNYQITKATGIAPALTKPARATIAVSDFLGNESTLDFTLAPDTAAPTFSAKPTKSAHGEFDAQAWGDYLALSATFDQPEATAPTGEIEINGKTTPLDFLRVNDKTYRALVHPEIAGYCSLRATHPRAVAYDTTFTVAKSGTVLKPACVKGLIAQPGSGTAYGTLFFSILCPADPPKDPIRRLGDAWRLGPENQPLRDGLNISLPRPPGSLKHAAIYRFANGGWSYLDTKASTDLLSATTNRLGTFAVLEDLIPPVISNIQAPAPNTKSPRRPTLSAKLHDIGSGLDTLTLTCDDHWLIPVYDPEKSTLTWDRDEDLPPGQHTLTFRVTDRAGNATTATRVIDVE